MVVGQVGEGVGEDEEEAAGLAEAGVVGVAGEVVSEAEQAVSEAEERVEVAERAAREIGHGRIRTRRAGRTMTGRGGMIRRWRGRVGCRSRKTLAGWSRNKVDVIARLCRNIDVSVTCNTDSQGEAKAL